MSQQQGGSKAKMPLEIEAKFLDVDHRALAERLGALGAARQGRWLERNEVFDDAARTRRDNGVLVRLRERAGAAVLTVKHSAGCTESGSAKACVEIETAVADAQAMRGILDALGLLPVFRYEKIREKWSLGGCAICLDTLPFGLFLEIEGQEADIRACAERLGLDHAQASAATYYDLNRQRRAAAGLPPDESFEFSPEAKSSLVSSLAEE